MRISLSIAALSTVAFMCTANAAPTYRLVDLGLLPGYEGCTPQTSNSDGVVTGSCSGGGQPGATFIWTSAAGMQPWPHAVSPHARNDIGQVAGRTLLPDGSSAFAFAENDFAEPVLFLQGSWADQQYTSIVAMNNRGRVLGRSVGVGAPVSPWTWSSAAGLTDPLLPPYPSFYEAYAINDHDQIAGSLVSQSLASQCSQRAMIHDLRSGRTTFIGPGPASGPAYCGRDSAATAMNHVGQAVGWGNRHKSSQRYDLFVWTAETGPVPLSGDDDHGMYDKLPRAINDAGQVVGSYTRLSSYRYRYFYWDKDTGMKELEDLIDPADPLKSKVMLWGLENPAALLTQDGRIVVEGSYKPRPPYLLPERPFMLVPIGATR